MEVMGENALSIPEYFVSIGKPNKRTGKSRVKLVNPLTKARHLATRGGQTAFRIIRKPIDDMIILENHTHPIPLSAFTEKDRKTIIDHFEVIKSHRGKNPTEIPNAKDFKNAERGRPETLPKNIEWHKVHKKITKGKKVKIIKTEPKPQEPEPDYDNMEIEEAKPIKIKIKKLPPKIPEPIIEKMPEKKSRGRPKKYTTDAERKAMKTQQTIASNKRKAEERRKLKGGGIWDDIKKTTNKAVKAVSNAKDVVVKGVSKAVKDVSAYQNAVLNGRDDYPPKCRKILKDNGDAIITEMKIKRTPVPSILTSALSGLSFGQFGKNQKDAGYDTLFHLFLEMRTVNGRRLQVEKNEVINMDIDPPERPNTEMRTVKNVPQGMTFQQIMDNTQQKQGGKYFLYSSRDNNCQDYILAVLESNGCGDAEDYAFVKQDTKKLYDNLSGLRKISNTLTDLGGRANVAMNGVGVGGNGDLIHIDLNSHNGKNYKMGEGLGDGLGDGFEKYIVQSVVFDKDKWDVKSAKKWLKENEHKASKVDTEANTLRFRQINPDHLKKIGYSNFKTKKLGKSGIMLVIAYFEEKKMSGKGIGMGKKLFDQKFSLNDVKHFVKKDVLGKKDVQKPKTNGILDQQFSVNEAIDTGKHLFGKGYEGTDSEARVHRGLMGNGVAIHHHHHYHFNKKMPESDSDSESDEERPMRGGKVKMSKTSKAIVKGLKTIGHYAIPAATSALGAAAGELIAPELGPISGVAGSAAGAYAGNQINKKIGIGLKKGSQAMKDKMARIRAMRK